MKKGKDLNQIAKDRAEHTILAPDTTHLRNKKTFGKLKLNKPGRKVYVYE